MDKTLTPYLLEKISSVHLDSPLLRYRGNVTSQNGEDGIIKKIFEVIGVRSRYCVEFGAWDGQYLSNCWSLVKNESWRGCFIEGDPKKFLSLKRNFSSHLTVNCVNRFVGLSKTDCVDAILDEVNAPRDLDLMSIDIDGNDYHVWESLVLFQPQLVVIEFNPTIPNDVIFVQAVDPSIHQGSSLHALILLGKKKGYELVCCTEWNAFFVRSSLFEKFEIQDNSIEKLYSPQMDGRVFHGFDSSIFVIGMPRLMWSEIPVSSEDFQVLPKSKRWFPGGNR